MKKILVLCFAVLLPLSLYAQEPKFSDYAVPVYKGKRAPIKLNAETRTFRTRVKNAAREGDINFAGGYVFSTAGCGTGCIFGMLYHAPTGKTMLMPTITGCYVNSGDYLDLSLEYSVDSRLLKIWGRYGEEGCAVRYFEEQNGKLKLIRKEPYTKARDTQAQ